VTSFSADTATRVLELFEKVCANEKVVMPLFLDAFVAILQTAETADNKFLEVILQRDKVFDRIKSSSTKLAVMRSYVDIAAEVMNEERKSTLSGGELLAILDELEFDDNQPLQPMRQLHTFGGDHLDRMVPSAFHLFLL
jgi:uncharacterized protein (UPF0147 family)